MTAFRIDRWIVRVETPDVSVKDELLVGVESAELVGWFEALAADRPGWDGARERRSVEH